MASPICNAHIDKYKVTSSVLNLFYVIIKQKKL